MDRLSEIEISKRKRKLISFVDYELQIVCVEVILGSLGPDY